MNRIRIGDIAEVISDRIDNPSESGYERFVGLEHYDSGEVVIRRYGNTDMLISSMKAFREQDTLVARRNVYLRRAAMVDFPGITSGDSIVLRAKRQDDAMILPFILNTESFWDYANQFADGSMSKRLSPKLLLDYETSVPDGEDKTRLSDLLWRFQATRRSYQNLIACFERLVKSQFIERIGKGSYKTVPAGTVMYNMRNGVSPSKNGTYREKVLTLSAVTQSEFDAGAWKDGSFDDCPPPEKRITSTDFYMCRGNGNKTLVGRGVIAPEDRPDLVFPDTVIAATIDTDRIMIPFLFYAWQQDTVRRQIEIAARTTNGTYKINQAIISGIDLILPPVEAQKDFIAFASQLDKSKHSAQKALEDLQATQKALIRKYLG